MRPALTFLMAFVPALTLVDEPAVKTPREQYDALAKDYEAADEVWIKSVPKPSPEPGDQFWIEHYKSSPGWSFAPRFLAFAEAHPQDPAAKAALVVIQMNPSTRDGAVFSYYLRARDLVIRDHLEDENVVRAFLANPTFIAGNTEPYFRTLLARSTNRDTLARACLALVRCHETRLRIAERPFFDHPDDNPEMLERSLFLTSRLAPDYLTYIRTTDVPAIQEEISGLLERVVREDGAIPLIPAWARPEIQAKNAGRTLADSAKAQLYRIRNLSPGRVAPEIEGQDLDGEPMRLSDYRGRVVVLVFWGSWCGPCMRSIPMEKALAARLRDQPFAIVGVNSDPDREQVKGVVAQEGITWRSWFDGGKTGGPIAERWNIRGWPAIIVIDKGGVIRSKGLPHHTPRPLDDAVDSLLAEKQP